MKPDRPDIAAPLFPPDAVWIGAEPKPMERMTAKGPVLVHFFEAGELSGVRTLPYVSEWAERYAEHGFSVVGVHTPRSPMIDSTEKLQAALDRLEISFPVALDHDYRIWHDYGCEGWPSSFLWGRGGALRWFQFGGGEFQATELAIQAQINEEALPEPMAAIRPTDEPDARVIPPTKEMYPGGDLTTPWSTPDGEPLWVEYDGAGICASLEGEGTVSYAVTDGPQGSFEMAGPGVYEIAEHGEHARHEVRIDLPPGVRIWAVGFAPGLA